MQRGGRAEDARGTTDRPLERGSLRQPSGVRDTYASRAALAMGQHFARKLVFLADGARSTWELQQTNFPGSVGILDFFHASEHLGVFCDLLKDPRKAQATHTRWAHMLKEGQALQVTQEMRRRADTVADGDAAIREINYFKNNLSRMDYDQYQGRAFPSAAGWWKAAASLLWPNASRAAA